MKNLQEWKGPIPKEQNQDTITKRNYLSQSAKGKLVDMLTPFLIAPHLLQMENESEATKP